MLGSGGARPLRLRCDLGFPAWYDVVMVSGLRLDCCRSPYDSAEATLTILTLSA
jgi:hypothetical protein